jgi:hypothetical protein
MLAFLALSCPTTAPNPNGGQFRDSSVPPAGVKGLRKEVRGAGQPHRPDKRTLSNPPSVSRLFPATTNPAFPLIKPGSIYPVQASPVTVTRNGVPYVSTTMVPCDKNKPGQPNGLLPPGFVGCTGEGAISYVTVPPTTVTTISAATVPPIYETFPNSVSSSVQSGGAARVGAPVRLFW